MIRDLCRLLVVAVVVAGCGKEAPTDIGGGFLPGGGLQTFELTLDAPSFLVSDSVLGDFQQPSAAPFTIVADQFGGTVESHTLARFPRLPIAITVLDSTGTTFTDTLPSFFGGRLVVAVDTQANQPTQPVQLRLYRTAEEWDAPTASWTLRVDSGGVKLPWATPGGTVGPLVDTASYVPGADSITFRVDSATLAEWDDTTFHNARGALIVATTSGSRIRATAIALRVDAHSSIRSDTVVTLDVGAPTKTFIYTPQAPTPTAGLRVGGVPAWRSYLRFVDALRGLTVPCPGGPAGCTLRLRDVSVNYAALLLAPAPSPPGFLPEDSLRFDARGVTITPLLPLGRSPLGASVTLTPKPVPASRFAGGDTARVEVPITPFVAALLQDTTTVPGPTTPPRSLALINFPAAPSFSELQSFGVAPFYGVESGPLAPRLRLIVTVANEVQLP